MAPRYLRLPVLSRRPDDSPIAHPDRLPIAACEPRAIGDCNPEKVCQDRSFGYLCLVAAIGGPGSGIPTSCVIVAFSRGHRAWLGMNVARESFVICCAKEMDLIYP